MRNKTLIQSSSPISAEDLLGLVGRYAKVVDAAKERTPCFIRLDGVPPDFGVVVSHGKNSFTGRPIYSPLDVGGEFLKSEIRFLTLLKNRVEDDNYRLALYEVGQNPITFVLILKHQVKEGDFSYTPTKHPLNNSDEQKNQTHQTES